MSLLGNIAIKSEANREQGDLLSRKASVLSGTSLHSVVCEQSSSPGSVGVLGFGTGKEHIPAAKALAAPCSDGAVR